MTTALPIQATDTDADALRAVVQRTSPTRFGGESIFLRGEPDGVRVVFRDQADDPALEAGDVVAIHGGRRRDDTLCQPERITVEAVDWSGHLHRALALVPGVTSSRAGRLVQDPRLELTADGFLAGDPAAARDAVLAMARGTKQADESAELVVEHLDLLLTYNRLASPRASMERIFRELHDPERVTVMRTLPWSLVRISNHLFSFVDEDEEKKEHQSKRAVRLTFPSADRIARRLGANRTSEVRSEVAVRHVLEEMHRGKLEGGEGGDTLLGGGFVQTALVRFGVPVEALTDHDDVRHIDGWCGRARYVDADRLIGSLVDDEVSSDDFDLERALTFLRERIGCEPDQEQVDILRELPRHRLAVLTGVAGTSKSTVAAAYAAGLSGSVVTLGPTGTACSVLQAMTGNDAHTLHSYVRRQGRVAGSDGFPTAISDETSMVDAELGAAVLAAAPYQRFLFAGDDHQLPPISPGALLRDLISLDRVHVSTLTRIRRLDPEGRGIAELGGAFRDGVAPVASAGAGWSISTTSTTEMAVHQAVELATTRFRSVPPRPFLTGNSTLLRQAPRLGDVLVIVPRNDGPGGIWDMNRRLQERLNPNGEAARFVKFAYRVFDPVLWHRTTNHRSHGTRGVVVGGGPGGGEERAHLMVCFEGEPEPARVDPDDPIVPRYAVTAHRAQGLECLSAIVLVDAGKAGRLASCEWLYTSATRARREVLLIQVGSDSIERFLRRSVLKKRRTVASMFGALHLVEEAD